MERAAGSAAEYGQRTLETYSLEGGRINDRLAGLSDEAIRLDERRLHEQLQKIPPEAAQTDLSYVLDRGGFPLLSSRLSPVPKDTALKDRDYFQTLSGPAPPPVYVSKTFLGRFDGRLLFTVARPRRETGNLPTPDGFDGVVLVSVRPVVLADGMRRLLSEPTDRMALIREDGFVISTTTGPLDAGQPLPQVDPASPFHDAQTAFLPIDRSSQRNTRQKPYYLNYCVDFWSDASSRSAQADSWYANPSRHRIPLFRL